MNTGTFHKLTQAEKDRIARLFHRGWKVVEVMAEMQVPRTTVLKHKPRSLRVHRVRTR